MCLFDVQPETETTNLLAFLTVLNSANEWTTVSRSYLGKSVAKTPQLRVEAWFPHWYEKTAFGRFVDTWIEDLGEIAKVGKSYMKLDAQA